MHTDYTPQETERFWSKVDLSKADQEFACWKWLPTKTKYGYGQIQLRRHAHQAHRVAYQLAFGEIPKGLIVCHHCDNRSCVNPNHFFLGTHADNAQDREQKGRANRPSGEDHVLHKLTQSQVDEIRLRYAKGDVTYRQLSKEFGVSHVLIGYIVKEARWT